MSWNNALPLLWLLWPLWLSRRPEAASPLWARRSLIVLISLLTLRYLLWRCSASLNTSNGMATALSLLLLAAEGWLLLAGLLPLLLAWRELPDRIKQQRELNSAWQASNWRPMVDILVPTCGEPIEVLERSLLGCINQNYPHFTVWVLDDSNRAEVQQLAEKLGCQCLQRQQRNGAKAGNLNHGMQHSSAELIAVFDADFVPQQRFLSHTICFLQDPRIGLLQTPQSFMNADPVMRNLGMERWLLPDEESFYRWLEPVRDAWGAVVCAGTAFVARRTALEQVGGFCEAALSEDLVTGLLLQQAGWRLLYLPEKLSGGLAAESMLDFVRQRQRWAAGTLQSLWLPGSPLSSSKLNLGQRLALLEGLLHWLNTLPRLVLLLMPLSIGLLGTVPVRFTAAALVSLLLPLWGTVLLGIGWLHRGSRPALLGELTNWVLTVPITVTVLNSLAGHFGRFSVTPKHRPRSKGTMEPQLVLPLLGLLLLNILNLLGFLRLLWQAEGDRQALPLGLVWAGLNLLGLLVALRACWDPATNDPAPWLAISGPAKLQGNTGEILSCKLNALSQGGVEVNLLSAATPMGEGEHTLAWTDELAPLPVKVQQQQGNKLVMQWGELNNNLRQGLLLWLFCRDNCWPERQARHEWRALGVLLVRALTPIPAPGPLHRSVVPQGNTPGQPTRTNNSEK
jgi:cellulose synthase (UDP-forming)